MIFLCLLPQSCHRELLVSQLTLHLRQLTHGCKLVIKASTRRTRGRSCSLLRVLPLLNRLWRLCLLL
jgi:hypothetical protein